MKRRSGRKLRGAGLREERRLTSGLVNHRAPALSPDGRWLCMQVGDGEQASWLVCDFKGRPAMVLTGPAEGGASFAPDNTLVYGRRVGATSELWRLESGGAEPHMLLGGDGALYRDPAFSKDGRWLCFVADSPSSLEEGAARLWIMDTEDGSRTEVAGVPVGPRVRVGRPAFAPDPDQIYFEASVDDQLGVYLLRRTTQSSRLLLAGASSPAPLGSDLVLVARERSDGQSELLLVDHAGEDALTRVLTAPARCAREPSAVVRKGAIYVACAMLHEEEHGEPRRYELCTARLAGVRR